ncbi:hypothetical protein NBRGN_010_00330 [Nocardia brasiliensis NBRC 14402]|nr:hypothetical protein NBRGN_010_00330 [Nocardia brasiliensis NBRC 14402]SUB11307.1 Uncharacterised protein [Nocardia brasiliensis]
MRDASAYESTPVRITQAHQFYGRAVTNPSAPPPPRKPGDWLLQVALSLFALGLLAIFAIFLIPVFSDSTPGLWLYFGAMLVPLGLLVAVVYALRAGRRSR